MRNYKDFTTLLQNLKNDIETVNGFILENVKQYTIDRKINGNWENIILSQYKNSEDLILIETNESTFTVSRWDTVFSISQQITNQTK